MLHYIKKWVLPICLALISVTAYAADTEQQPLMIIRFNQEHVPYERPLYTTLSHTLEVYPQAHFMIASVSPKIADHDAQQSQDALSEANLRRVEATLKEMGMPEDRVTIHRSRETLNSSEVRIFVQ